MNDLTLVETEARHRIRERVTRASRPSLPSTRHRHRVAERLRRIADRIDD